MRRRERALRAVCWVVMREVRAEFRAEREVVMRVRESLSGVMWNWFVVSEMS